MAMRRSASEPISPTAIAIMSAATATVQGSGWGVLAWEPLSRRLVVEQVYDHHGNVGMNTTPLLVLGIDLATARIDWRAYAPAGLGERRGARP